MKLYKLIIPALLISCMASNSPALPPNAPNLPTLAPVSITSSPAGNTIVYAVTWTAPTEDVGQPPVVGYRTYITHGDLTLTADTLVERTVGNVLTDSLTITISTDTLTQIRGVIRSIGSNGVVSGIAGSAPASFNLFPLPPNPPNNPGIRQISP